MSEPKEKKAPLNTILCIDDSEIDTFIAEKVLTREGITERVICCHSGQSGLDTLQEMTLKNNLPDRILLDINMPGMTGFEFLTHYEKMFKPGPDRCKVIIVSSSNNYEDKERAAGFNSVSGYIQKPLTSIPSEKILEALQILAPM